MIVETIVTVREILESSARRYADHIALLAPDRAPLMYNALYNHAGQIAAQLNRMGIGRGDRVAIVLTDSAELIIATLSISTVAATAFLKTTLSADDYADLFNRLRVKAVVLERDVQGAARDVARANGLIILELSPRSTGAAGLFDLTEPEGMTLPKISSAQPDYAHIDDIAFFALTSGTTGRPKLIPISHRMIAYRTGPRAEVLGLNEKDRWLALTSLIQIGPIFNFLRTLMMGGGAVIPYNFDVAQFFDYLDTFQPTWFTAPATMYQAILANAASRGRSLAGTSVRFVRSGSMSLPPALMHQLEQAFQVPIVQGYGITETGSLANNPLPPAPNKPGSAGLVAGHEVQIVDDAGRPLPVGTPGEITVRGPAVMRGYEGDPEATRKVFFGDWFRTGDQGYLDEDGYLFITGRVKELINRGGEKISPAHVENVLLLHPAVTQPVAFSIPDHRLGEEVGAAVVLDSDHNVTEKELREFAARHLAATQVPRRILFVADIPTTDVGKVQRSGLAEKFGLTANAAPESQAGANLPPYVAPRTALEGQIAQLWGDVLGVQQVSVNDEFLQLGGDSLAATRLISRLRSRLQIEITLLDFFDAPTVAQQAEIVKTRLNG